MHLLVFFFLFRTLDQMQKSKKSFCTQEVFHHWGLNFGVGKRPGRRGSCLSVGVSPGVYKFSLVGPNGRGVSEEIYAIMLPHMPVVSLPSSGTHCFGRLSAPLPAKLGSMLPLQPKFYCGSGRN